MKKVKKYIKHNLPAAHYHIVESYCAEDEVCFCDNCNKAIKNIAIVEDEHNHRFYVGMDCAETLSGITDDDIQYWSNGFRVARSLRNKINKVKKEHPYAVVRCVRFPYTPKECFCIFAAKCEEPSILRDYYYVTDMHEGYLKSYLPEYARIAEVSDYNEKHEKFEIESGEVFDGYEFRYELIQKNDWKYAHAAMYKDGVMIREDSNGGSNKESCQIECARIYDKEMFKKHLHPAYPELATKNNKR